jgi:hypothetical protein
MSIKQSEASVGGWVNQVICECPIQAPLGWGFPMPHQDVWEFYRQELILKPITNDR